MKKKTRVYLRQGQAEAWLTVYNNRELKLIICKVGEYRHLDRSAGGRLPAKQRAASLTLLKKIGQIIVDLAKERFLWYAAIAIEPRRERTCRRALSRAGLEIINNREVTFIKSKK